MKEFRVGIIGATGMVGQRFITLLENHPWFKVKVIAASERSAGKKYSDAIGTKWAMTSDIPKSIGNMIVMDAKADAEKIAKEVDFVFCAVDMPKDELKSFEEMYAKLECPVISNNSAHRGTQDVPMILPEVNPHHAEIIPQQRKRLGTKRGFIAVKPNCSLQSYVPAIHPLREAFGVKNILVCTYQAISGAGKTFDTWQEMLDNVIPYIGGEEEKTEQEPMKIWGRIDCDKIENAVTPSITAQCLRVPVSDGHMAAVFVRFEKNCTENDIKKIWSEYRGEPQILKLPSAPKQFLNYFEEPSFPQTKLHRNLEGGMAVSIGRLRKDTQYDYKFVSLSHNTIRGAAGGAILVAELLAAKGYLD